MPRAPHTNGTSATDGATVDPTRSWPPSGAPRRPSPRSKRNAGLGIGGRLCDDGRVVLSDDQQRAVVATCCAVARADGEVSPAEIESLLELLARLAGDSMSYAELQRWLEQGPPEIVAQLGEAELRTCIREALTVAKADGTIDDAELATIKKFAERHLERA